MLWTRGSLLKTLLEKENNPLTSTLSLFCNGYILSDTSPLFDRNSTCLQVLSISSSLTFVVYFNNYCAVIKGLKVLKSGFVIWNNEQ